MAFTREFLVVYVPDNSTESLEYKWTHFVIGKNNKVYKGTPGQCVQYDSRKATDPVTSNSKVYGSPRNENYFVTRL